MKKVELLAPAGNYEAFLGAIHAGADAVYLGGEKYGARANADNFTEEEIISAIRYAHLFGKKVYLTVNTLLKEEEYKALFDYIKPFYENGLDGVIVQDMGAFFLMKRCFPRLELHASTQMTLTGALGVAYLKEIGASRVVPARELSLEEIREIKDKIDIEIECFVHGAMCYCYSGQCLFSSILGGRSGNRGRCAQPCRLPYKYSEKGQECYPFSLKDMCTVSFVPKLIEAGIDSFKIEGRMKKPEYAAGVTAIYRKYIDKYYKEGAKGFKVSKEDLHNLSKLYIRSEIQDGYYFRHNGKEMITPEKPSYMGTDETYLELIRKTYIENGPKLPIFIKGTFTEGKNAILRVKYKDIEADIEGDLVDKAQNRPMSCEDVEKQLKKLGNTIFTCEKSEISVGDNIFIPNKALNELRRKALNILEEKIIEKNGFDTVRDDSISPKNTFEVNRGNSKTWKDNSFIVSVTTKEQLEALKQKNYSKIERVYIDYALFMDLSREETDKLMTNWTIGVAYPRIIRKNGLEYLEALYEKSREIPVLLIKNLETLQFLKEKNYQGTVICDYTMYVCNEGSSRWISTVSDGFCYPVELNRNELSQIAVTGKQWKEQLLYGYLPLMVTANCIKKTTDRCGQNGNDMIFDRYKKSFVSKSRCELCYSEIYNCVPLSLHKYMGDFKHAIDGYRIDFTLEDYKITGQVLDAYFSDFQAQLPGEYTTGHFKRGVE